MMKAGELTTYCEILTCPACHTVVHATLKVDPNLGGLKAVSIDELLITADPKVVGLAVHHQCGGAQPPPEAAKVAAP